MKFKQNERVYFRIKEGGPEGWATVAGDFDLIIILKPEIQVGAYTHIYVTNTQLVDPPKEKKPVVESVSDSV